MTATVGGPACLMILHVWVESGHRLRVRLIRTDDVESGQTVTSYASTAPEVVAAVQRWLDEITGPSPAATGESVTPL